MTQSEAVSFAQITAAREANPKLRERDLASQLGLSEGQLVAAAVGHGVTRITADMDRLMPPITRLGEVMALTRNESCVIEKVGVYDNYQGGQHACMVLNETIDMRMFQRHWVHAFAVEAEGQNGLRRSLQIFDAAGDAVHKVHLREASDLGAWVEVVAELAEKDQTAGILVAARAPVEDAKGTLDQAERLRTEWDRMTDTHQFLMMTRKLKMNRLGAYRIAGAPYVEKLSPDCIPTLLATAAANKTPIMAFVGNDGCIEIHTGPVQRIVEMGPWINVLDAGFDFHLRNDRVAEVWLVTKNTRRGPAVSVEAFDAEGGLITQFFGVLRDEGGADAWQAVTDVLERASDVGAA